MTPFTHSMQSKFHLLVCIQSLFSVPAVLHTASHFGALELVRHVYIVCVAGRDSDLRELFRGSAAPLAEGLAVVGVIEFVDQPVCCVAHLVDQSRAEALVVVYYLCAYVYSNNCALVTCENAFD